MNGIMLGHWGCITWPDNEWKENILLNEDGSFEKFEDSLPCRIQTVIKPWKHVEILDFSRDP